MVYFYLLYSLVLLWYLQLVLIGVLYLIHRYLLQLPYLEIKHGSFDVYWDFNILLFDASFIGIPQVIIISFGILFSLGIFPNWYLINHELISFGSNWYVLSCVDLDIWYNLDNLYACHAFVCISWFTWCFFQITSLLVVESVCMYTY